ncbi:DUF4405 domain-containing protein [Pseudodesulfovibrio cashew]|uniref:DUF4405 domain-containing protein n=1 Tax=Pseudodesulfovibrio cashew TaxID=2678688 RepID=A0A6I6JEE2_9BACT|nr:DUF4405 domain-containing protein [Pseudodesulfovibrio cashew]QGY39539.1 DUF4405 domain-containing protein [Pseudodesulfovibrio cashew]
MTQLKKNRAFVSTATAFTFIPMMITSLLLLFHVRFPGVMDIHKWVGLAFVLLCFLHIPINWSVLRKHLAGKAALPALCLTALLTAGMLLVGLTGDGGKQHYAKHNGYARMNTRY